ncbi:DUF3263 domain-containing protein [Streptomyces sp. NPDC001904]|uniref:DUF3263 domain-containing protein n=1 Tax=Streptomyces sp. NPDC001904 TaxID=3154531 RepID=UPI00332D5250
MLRPATNRPEGAAIWALHTAVHDIQHRCGELPGADVVYTVERWLEQFDFSEPTAPDHPEEQPLTLETLGIRYLLAVADRTYATPGRRDDAIRTELGLSPARYFLLLNAVIDQTAALRLAPVTVNRLRRLREVKRSAREGGSST